MNLETKVLGIISDFCDNIDSFTSLDVSNKVKEDGFSTTRHREIAPLVRKAYDDGEMDLSGYIRILINVTLSSGETKPAFLYHHQSVDPISYNRRNQIAIVPVDDSDDDKTDAQKAFDDALTNKRVSTQQIFDNALAVKHQPQRHSDVIAPAPRIVNTDAVEQNVGPLDTAERETTYDGRVEIPAGWVSNMGWVVGTAIYAILDDAKIVLKHDVIQGENVLGTMYVNNDGRLRLTRMASINACWPVIFGHCRELSRFADRIEVERVE